MIKTISISITLISLGCLSSGVAAKTKADNKNADPVDTQDAVLLSYIEREPGVDEYEMTMLVSDRYIRVDEAGEASGYIVYDDKTKTIYSVSHQDKSIFVIKEHAFSGKNSPVKSQLEYLQLADAPSVDGKQVYNYRVFTGKDDAEETCLEVQLVENLLPQVSRVLKNYQSVISGQQVKLTDNKVTELQSPCFFVDQVYNSGLYYDKGLPIQEWHSNESSRILSSYKKVKTSKDKFTLPEKYRRFSVDIKSKIPIK